MIPKVCLINSKASLNNADFQFLLRLSPAEKQQRIMRQHVAQNAVNMAVGGALARYMLWKEWRIAPDAEIGYGEFGKPYLLDYPNAHFNISHSGQFVACAICDKPVGVDVQEIVPYRPDVATKVCSGIELVQIEKSANQSKVSTEIWTQKEVLVKVMGLAIWKGIPSDLANYKIYTTSIGSVVLSSSVQID